MRGASAILEKVFRTAPCVAGLEQHPAVVYKTYVAVTKYYKESGVPILSVLLVVSFNPR